MLRQIVKVEFYVREVISVVPKVLVLTNKERPRQWQIQTTRYTGVAVK